MSPRPRKASDEEIFAAAQRVMSRVGPAQLTLADIAAEAGLTAGALVQRFGSKRGLLVTVTARAAAETPTLFAQLRATHASPLATIRAYADCMAQLGESPAAFAQNLAYLQRDLTDHDLHRHVRAQARATRTAFRTLLEDAVAAGELRPDADTHTLARAIEVTITGSLLTWALYEEGPVTTWLRQDLDTLLRPYTSRTSTRRARRSERGAARPTTRKSTRRHTGQPPVPRTRSRRGPP